MRNFSFLAISLVTSVTLPSRCYGSLMPSFFRFFTTFPLSLSTSSQLNKHEKHDQEKLGIFLLNLGGPEKQEVYLSSTYPIPMSLNLLMARMCKDFFITYLLIQISFGYPSFLAHLLLFRSQLHILSQRIGHPNPKLLIKVLVVVLRSICTPETKPKLSRCHSQREELQRSVTLE
jgi:hypothetical protein